MTEDMEKIRKELEEIQKIKEDLKRELEDVRSSKSKRRRLRAEAKAERKARAKRVRAEEKRLRAAHPISARPPRPPREPRAAIVDLSGLTESLEEMMVGLGDSIRESVRGFEDLGAAFAGPAFKIRTGKRTKEDREIEGISPERVARIVSPLGSEERLNILDYLKEGGRSFNEIENHTGKTGSSLTHHLSPLLDAGYVIKGEVRGTYYVTVEGRLAYRLAQWLTSKVERQRSRSEGNGSSGLEKIIVDHDDEFDVDIEEEIDEEMEELGGEISDRLDDIADQIDDYQDQIDDIQDEIEDTVEELEEEDYD